LSTKQALVFRKPPGPGVAPAWEMRDRLSKETTLSAGGRGVPEKTKTLYAPFK